MQKLAPIAIFAFNRPVHLHHCLSALSANELACISDVIIFCDAPRNNEEKKLTDAVQKIAYSATGFGSLTVVSREKNMRCAGSIINGVSNILSSSDRIIVIEDDIVCSKYTLRFLNNCLDKYEKEHTVFSISAWSPPSSFSPIPATYTYDAYFVPRFNCWGWASWRDRWEVVDWEVSDYETFKMNPTLREAYNQGGDDLTPLLDAFMADELDSWAVRMCYAGFKHGGLGLIPVHSYSTNIGIGSGTNSTSKCTLFENDIDKALCNPNLPMHIFVDYNILASYRKAYKK